MDDNLQVRVYDVDFGDCIYVRVPDKERAHHILIDCGNSYGDSPNKLKRAFEDVYERLPLVSEDAEKRPPVSANPDARRLDLLVVTHRHWDHLRGFDPALLTKLFKQVQIDRIWLSPAMKKGHPQAKGLHALQARVQGTMERLRACGLELSPRLHALMMKSISTADAADLLRGRLPEDNGIVPMYIYRGLTEDEKWLSRCFEGNPPSQPEGYFLSFDEPDSSLRVLAPEWDIDHYYLGEELQDGLAAMDDGLHPLHLVPEIRCKDLPINISRRDFQQLRARMLYTALAFAEDDSDLANNTSVVLLLEWRGRRLLFAGDAEWAGGYEEKAMNGSWDVMLHKGALSGRLDFLKVGHHGSRNGTPWNSGSEQQAILDEILPLDGHGGQPGAKIVVSTRWGRHGDENPVPYAELMRDLGLRASNWQEYAPDDPQKPDKSGGRQPPRTDKEPKPIEVTFDAAPGWQPD